MKHCKTPMVSVIVPVYNTQDYIAECLNSLVAQTLIEQDPETLEIIVVNDASADHSMSIVKAFEAQYPHLITVLQHDQNRGLGVTRNRGIEAASGTYIGFVDSDDYVSHDMFEQLLIEAVRQNADQAACGMIQFDGLTQRSLSTHVSAERTSVCNKLFRREFILKHSIRFAEGQLFEDEIFSYMVDLIATRTADVDDVWYFYRVNPEGICRKAGADQKRLYARMNSVTDFMETMKQRGLLESSKALCLKMLCRHAMLQIQTDVGWIDLMCYWRFTAHIIERYRLTAFVLPNADDYFVRKFVQLSEHQWRLWLTRVISRRALGAA
ncbi:glycosyltransferase [Echinimonas agarilytica]|uniref:Glycosyltransferase n=1 Tax=Echinimonas agarilytica TaxID=1215918 RepID=A0AA41W6A2_9GAMM|nr:glycosyltransferase [Echinimonas agarilytica]MCM2679536.1 glycosyltransferase [Echinimonas agarilytica]